MGRARLLVEERRFEEAVAILEPLNADAPDPRIEVLLGRAYRALGREEDARIAAAKGSSAPSRMQWLDPRLALRTPYIAGFGNRLQHAQNLIQAGRAKDALPLAEELLAERPDDLAAINTVVWANAALDRFGTAKSVLYAGIERYPEEPRLHQMLANAYLQEGDVGSARHHLEEVTKLAPSNARALEQLGWLLAQQGRPDDGIELLERALEAGAREPKQVLYRLGLLHGTEQRWQEAAARFEEAVRIDAAFTMAYVHLGRCRAEAGDFDGAREALDWADRLGLVHKDGQGYRLDSAYAAGLGAMFKE
jgi:Flp pilus assembly protein TadD